MEKQKLKLKADPTFTATVEIPVPGKAPSPVVFTFKHRTRDQFLAFAREAIEKKTPDLDYVLQMASGWDVDAEFTRENVAELLQQYHAAAQAIAGRYGDVLTEGRQGN